MRWQLLFEDLEAQYAAGTAAELAAEVTERTRHQLGEISLGQRLQAATGEVLSVGLMQSLPVVVTGELGGIGPDWLLLTEGPTGLESLIPLSAVAWVQGLGRRAEVHHPGRVWSRLGLRAALRGITRDRSGVTVHVRGSHPCTGTLDRVGADHADLAVHELDMARRPEAVRGVRSIPFAALLAVQRR
jgi:hypothetical protein